MQVRDALVLYEQRPDIELVNDLPDNLQQQVLAFVLTLRQEHLQKSGDAWDVLESFTGTLKFLPIGQ